MRSPLLSAVSRLPDDSPRKLALVTADGYEVYELDDGSVEATIVKDDGAGPYLVRHSGTPESVRARCAVDARPADKAAIVEVALSKAKYPDDPPKPAKEVAILFDLEVDP